ncbi:MAG TPA: hypothetical protein VKT70_12980, partial [Stellaceae bacterium]|nr:hypothetical protein [Stellaceae bacterium]
MTALSRLPRAELEAMAEAGRRLRAQGRQSFSEEMRGLKEWVHYPEGDVYDPLSHSQYFFHLHPRDQRGAREYGHFHTFLR